jgi:hypothetical protein
LRSAAEFIVGKATRMAGVAGRKVFGLPVHVAVPLALLFGAAVVILASQKARDPLRPSPGNSRLS